ncbi:hypothetical protein N6H18_03170 [Reichenbachiella agarivorans]|uniref:Tetratricopeptide repeat-containing protein n=1 Tax=Reichenbachiella agarivorans TaxID=2979464 RepID=A0ABY6CXK8_9BACT|nr:hypothetical protein [Reichenbachiella agarivorans]UXP32955.1 hypothetical protein N6H18_03170 [Reichenbachiella agarivorans]
MKTNLLIFCTACVAWSHHATAQKLPVFDSPKTLAAIEKVAYYVYNEYPDSANMAIDKMALKLPNHPVIHMMRAMNIAWQDQPIRTTSPSFPAHQRELEKVIELAVKIRKEDPDNLEGLFFEMSAHGLLAEYYAREGSYVKAVTEAKKTYDFITETMEKTDESPEFYFLAGLYNYFREKYPERHPAYSPLLWFFKSGNKKLGLQQLDSAVNQSKIVKAEAHLYTAYIYLRYETDYKKAEYYIQKISKEYPRNSYFKTKHVESLVMRGEYKTALPMIEAFLSYEKPYYRTCGEVYMGSYQEHVLKSDTKAAYYYTKALATGDQDPTRGEYYRSLAYLGLGRVTERKGEIKQAIEYYQQAIDLDESDLVTKEAKERLNKID